MHHTDTGSGDRQPSDLAPGDRAPAGRAAGQLDRAPGERYRPAEAGDQARTRPRPGAVRSGVTVLIVAAAGSGVFALGGSFDLGVGMLVVAAFLGWAIGLAVVWVAPAIRVPGLDGPRRSRRRAALAALAAAGSLIAGLLVLWAWSRLEGGVLGPVAYADARFGLLAAVQVLIAAVVAGIRAR